jgi:hypothetical protein
VNDDALQVTLRFGGNPEALTVPWAALRAFADPSVGFGMRLQAAAAEGADPTTLERPEGEGPKAPEAPVPVSSAASAKVVDFGAFRRRDDGEA